MSSPILEVIDSPCGDLIVMGTAGRTGLKHLLLGSLAEDVVRKARVLGEHLGVTTAGERDRSFFDCLPHRQRWGVANVSSACVSYAESPGREFSRNRIRGRSFSVFELAPE